jgi:hypothetical protein
LGYELRTIAKELSVNAEELNSIVRQIAAISYSGIGIAGKETG